MSNPFPSKEYIDLCIKHQVILAKEWENLGPRKGDFYIARRTSGDELKVIISNRRAKNFNAWSRTHEKVFIPRPDQLIKMLEKRGYGLQLYVGTRAEVGGESSPYAVSALRIDRVIHYPLRRGEAVYEIDTIGSTPAIALLKTLTGTVKEGGEDAS